MNLATLFLALIATTAADANAGDPVLLDFQATWCGPCREMRPAIEQLVAKGYPVKPIDIDRSPDLKDRYHVEAVPTFVVVDARGKELARTQGLMPAKQLATFYNEAKLRAAASTPAPVEEAQDRSDLEVPAGEAGEAPSSTNPNPWETVVRIKMHLSDREWGFGSGTVIYSSAEESIILTCAHIFRIKGQQQPSPKNFRVPISIDLFGREFVQRKPAQLACIEKDVPGEAIDYDFTNDVGLIRIRPGRKLACSRVVPASWQPKKGMSMVTVGCSHGNDATAWSTKILDPRVGMSNTSTKESFATIKCDFQPKEGRSGGGLYTSDGYVAGVCDFADPNEHVGLYAVPGAIHRLLDRNNLMALYKAPTNGGDVMLASSRPRAKPSTGTRARAQNPDEGVNPEDVTLPPPSMVGIQNPPSDGKPWRGREDEAASTRAPRRMARPEVAMGGDVDPGPRPGEARTTDLAGDPGPDAKALEADDEAAPALRPSVKPPTSTRPRTSGWVPVRQNAGDTNRPRPATR